MWCYRKQMEPDKAGNEPELKVNRLRRGRGVMVPMTLFLLLSYILFGLATLVAGESRMWVFILIRIIIVVWLLWKLWRGHQWARVLLGIYLILTFVFNLKQVPHLAPSFILDLLLRGLCGGLLLFAPGPKALVAARAGAHDELPE
jgi:hypothetical protein